MSEEDLKFAVVALSAIFFVIDPLANVPVFLSITGELSVAQRRKVALRAALATWVILSFFAIAGGLVFKAFGISLGAFKVAGGIMLLLMSIDMMRAQPSPTRSTQEERDESRHRDDIAIFPIAIPMLAGPGAIATVMVLIGKAKSVPQRMSVYTAILAVSLITFLVLRSAAYVARALGTTGINLIGRIMGLILAASSMQFVIDGLQEAFPKLLGEHVAVVVDTLTRAAGHLT